MRKKDAAKTKIYRQRYAEKGGPARERQKLRDRMTADPVFAEERRAKRRLYYAKNAKKICADQQTMKRSNPDRTRLWNYRSWRFNRATHLLSKIKLKSKRLGLACDLTKDWLAMRIAAGRCEMSGIPFDMEAKRGPRSPTVDRKDAKGGYTQENCRVIIWYLNRALSDQGDEMAIDVFRKVIARHDALASAPLAALSMAA